MTGELSPTTRKCYWCNKLIGEWVGWYANENKSEYYCIPCYYQHSGGIELANRLENVLDKGERKND